MFEKDNRDKILPSRKYAVNLKTDKYIPFVIVHEMLETVDLVRHFNGDVTNKIANEIKSKNSLLLTGEGSSRIFPAKNAIRKAHTCGLNYNIFTECSRQAIQYKLTDAVVFCASNSGKTKELIVLINKLKKEGNNNIYGVTANPGTLLEQLSSDTVVLSCGKENAVAATKSVVEQALIYESLLWNLDSNYPKPDLDQLASAIEKTLTLPLKKSIIDATLNAPTVYFAGYNDGVAEELTLKTNEITRKKSDYLEGTYAAHGIEEVMDSQDVVFVIDPIEEEIEKFQEVLEKGVGLKVIAIATHETPFETIIVPDAGDYNTFIFLCAGWNLLVEIGLAAGIDLDKPQRARKVGNEFLE